MASDALSKLFFLTAAVTLLHVVVARPEYASRIPNGNSVRRNGLEWPGVGHLVPEGGGTRNAYGAAFEAAGFQWTAALCAADSDGDGFSNGEELGDPACVWLVGAIPSRVADISHPGFPDSTPVESHDNATVPPAVTASTVITTTTVPAAATPIVTSTTIAPTATVFTTNTFVAQTTASNRSAFEQLLLTQVVGATGAIIVIESFSEGSGDVSFHFAGPGANAAEQVLLRMSASERRTQLQVVRLSYATTAAPPTTVASSPPASAATDGGLSTGGKVAIAVVATAVGVVLLVTAAVLLKRTLAARTAPRPSRRFKAQAVYPLDDRGGPHVPMLDTFTTPGGYHELRAEQPLQVPVRELPLNSSRAEPTRPAVARQITYAPSLSPPRHWEHSMNFDDL
jgi:hypothetical protein